MSSFGLTLYSLTARQAARAEYTPRPDGPLVWLVLTDPAQSEAALLLARRLHGDHGFAVLISGGEGDLHENGIVTGTLPADHPATVQEFLAHWQPDVIVILGSTLRPVLIDLAATKGIPMLLVQADIAQLLRGSDRWFFGLTRRSVLAFHAIMTIDETAARDYRRLGASNVARLGRMEAGSLALPHNEPERAALAALFATRPVWLAVDVPPEEEAAVIAAHRAALRLAHRLLLILVPSEQSRAPALAAALEASEGWIVARRDLDEEPDTETAVYIADTGQEYGLWYRLAPVTFMGGSLFGVGSARSPLEPAALGSAILHGRKTGAFGAAYGRLGAALGAAPVSTEGELAEFLTELLAPDRVARMAHAAWGVVSEGAEVTNRIVTTVLHLAEGKR